MISCVSFDVRKISYLWVGAICGFIGPLTVPAQTIPLLPERTGHGATLLESGKVLITSQNHGFAVTGDAEQVPGAPSLRVTHLNLNDGTIEGMRHRELPVFAVQYHPEAAPGPHDADYLFSQFIDVMEKGKTP